MDVTPLDGVLPAGQDSGLQTTLSRFNGWGQRFLRDTPNAQSVFSYGTEGFNLLSETTRNLSTSALSTTEHIWLPTASGTMPVAAVIDGVHYAVHADHLNTPRRLTDASQVVKWQWPYSGFGEIAPQSTPAAGQAPLNYGLRYPGQIDDGNGLFYNWHRFYDPRVGRYTSSDPIGLEGGWNRFGYVGGNPLSFFDPAGLSKCSCTATSTSGTGYTNGRKVCEYRCSSPDIPTPVNVPGGSNKGRDGDNCYGVELQTQPTKWGELVDVPTGTRPFSVDPDNWFDQLTYDDVFIDNLRNATTPRNPRTRR